MTERSDVTLDGNPVQLGGRDLDVGDRPDNFRLVKDLPEVVNWSDEAGDSVHIITSALSVDTPVCANQFEAFDHKAAELGDDVKVWYVSRDLPFALQRYADEHGIENVEFFSDYRFGEFGDNFGVDVEDFGLLARSTFVIDKNGEVVYRELLSEIGEEPDYDAAVEAARKAASS